jgi:uncharacterized protein YndB with AHSA1/START domain
MLPDRIETTTELNAAVDRVWHVLTKPQEVSEWFGARFEQPFVPGEAAPGIVTYPGYEGITFTIDIISKQTPTLFSFSWHPNTIDQERDYSIESPTLVEFHLEQRAGVTRLTVVETGFNSLPEDRAAEAFKANSEGWTDVLGRIAKRVALMTEPSPAVS